MMTNSQSAKVIASDAWREAFMAILSTPANSNGLRDAALNEDLKSWTALLTTTVVSTCKQMGLIAAAKGHRAAFLPQTGEEFLGLDVMAFSKSVDNEQSQTWQLPLAVFELENSTQDDRVGYSLWKVMCVRAPLRFVFAYRKSWELCTGLVKYLADTVTKQVIGDDYHGECVVVVGSRAEGESFPWGYFKFYQLNKNLLRFEKF